jgi:CelD/BcsL family acetyltransferase involved in cellulose biosynthesis
VIRFIPASSDTEWDGLLDAQPEARLYHTSAWLRLQERFAGSTLVPLKMLRDGAVVGLFPVFIGRRGVFRVCSSPKGIDTLFLGPLVAPELLGEALDGYEAWARENRVDFTSAAFAYEIDAQTARKKGYECKRRKTCLVDLRGGEEAVFKRSHDDCRTEVRKARRLGVRVVEADLAPMADEYVRLSARVLGRSHLKTLLTPDVFLDLIGTLKNAGRLISLRAERDGELLGMYVAAHFRKRVYALDTVSTEPARRYSSNRLMSWEVIGWGCRNGMEVLDLVGANMPSLAAFKLSFGGTLVGYSNITKPHSVTARAAVWLKGQTLDRWRDRRFRRSEKGQVQRQIHESERERSE